MLKCLQFWLWVGVLLLVGEESVDGVVGCFGVVDLCI